MSEDPMAHSVTQLWAFVCTDAAGDEVVLRRSTPIGSQPMVADSEERLMTFLSDAVDACDRMGLRLKLVRFGKTYEAPITLPDNPL